MPKLSLEQSDAISVLLTGKPTIHDIENMIIQHCLNKTRADVMLVAKELGIGKSTIYRKLRAQELEFP